MGKVCRWRAVSGGVCVPACGADAMPVTRQIDNVKALQMFAVGSALGGALLLYVAAFVRGIL